MVVVCLVCISNSWMTMCFVFLFLLFVSPFSLCPSSSSVAKNSALLLNEKEISFVPSPPLRQMTHPAAVTCSTFPSLHEPLVRRHCTVSPTPTIHTLWSFLECRMRSPTCPTFYKSYYKTLCLLDQIRMVIKQF